MPNFEQLKSINPNDGYNPVGSCDACAVETANVLVNGSEPIEITEENYKKLGLDSTAKKPTKTFKPGGERAQEVYRWLQTEAVKNAVYVVNFDGDEVIHVYNFAKTAQSKIFLLDTSQWLYKQITSLGDFVNDLRNSKEDEIVKNFNFADPDDEDKLELYYWGNLSVGWSQNLES